MLDSVYLHDVLADGASLRVVCQLLRGSFREAVAKVVGSQTVAAPRL